MQIGNKRTALKDNAALYTHETDGLTDKEIMKSLKGRKKWIQFRDYYLMKIIAIMAVLAFVGSLLYTVLKPKPKTIFYAAVCDMTVDLENRDLIEKDFQEYVGIDKEKEDILFDSAYYFETDEVSSQQ